MKSLNMKTIEDQRNIMIREHLIGRRILDQGELKAMREVPSEEFIHEHQHGQADNPTQG